LGPHEATVKWDDKGVIGVKRFLDRVWVLVYQISADDRKKKNSETVERAINKLIKKVGEDVESFRFNTSVAAFMEFINTVKDEPLSVDSIKKFLVLLYPFAPHITEELYQMLGSKKSLQLEKWPKFNPKKVVDETVEVVVQVNGKVRDKLQVLVGASEAVVKEMALQSDKIKAALTGEPKRVIFVPNKIISFVL
jgi:leucyl-tRNA synthetase